MAAILIQQGLLRLEVDPSRAGAITQFSVSKVDSPWVPVFRPAINEAGWSGTACYPLAPWSNRIAAACFRYRGIDIPLAPDWPDGTAIHGVTKDRPWVILDRSPCSVRLGCHIERSAPHAWPWTFTATVRYELSDTSLSAELVITNHDASPMPAGGGFHPFFMRHLWHETEDAILSLPARSRFPAHNQIPTSAPIEDDICRALSRGITPSHLTLDDVFVHDSGRPWATIAWPESGIQAEINCTSTATHAVVYAPNDSPGWFCVEPVTMANDGFNLFARHSPDSGVVELAPGHSLMIGMSITLKGLQ